MLFFDQLKKNDPQLRVLAIVILSGLCVLAAGLWWVQIVSARDYRVNQVTQSVRTVRIPAVRGKITDRNGYVLAENQAVYNISLNLDDFRKPFNSMAANERFRLRKDLKQKRDAKEKSLGRHLTKEETKPFLLSRVQVEEVEKQARYAVSSNLLAELSSVLRLPEPLLLNPTNFEHHYLRPAHFLFL